ncbi:hypothetical protein AB6A40_011849, partial [Gnathostoma spinigerum]
MCEPATISAFLATYGSAIAAGTAAVGTGLSYDAQQKAGYKQQYAIDTAQAEQNQLASKRQEAVAEAASKTFKPQTAQNFVQPAQDRLEGVAQQAQT